MLGVDSLFPLCKEDHGTSLHFFVDAVQQLIDVISILELNNQLVS